MAAGVTLVSLFTVCLGGDGFVGNDRIRVALNEHLHRGELTRWRIVRWGLGTGLMVVLLLAGFIAGGIVLLDKELLFLAAIVGVAAWVTVVAAPGWTFLKCGERLCGRTFPAPKTVLGDYFALSRQSAGTPDTGESPLAEYDELDWLSLQGEQRAFEAGEPRRKN
jgi:hypothetical protein